MRMAVGRFALLPALQWLLVSGLAAAQAPEPEFAIRSDGRYIDPASIWRYDARSTAIPINKRYEELSSEQKAMLAAQYQSLGPGDEPPFPKAGIQSIVEALIKAQDQIKAVGPLRLLVSVDATGKAKAAHAYGTLKPQMVKFASYVLLLTEFKPALCAGQPCEMDYLFLLDFKLE